MNFSYLLTIISKAIIIELAIAVLRQVAYTLKFNAWLPKSLNATYKNRYSDWFLTGFEIAMVILLLLLGFDAPLIAILVFLLIDDNQIMAFKTVVSKLLK